MSVGPAPGIEPTTSRCAVKRSTATRTAMDVAKAYGLSRPFTRYQKNFLSFLHNYDVKVPVFGPFMERESSQDNNFSFLFLNT